MPPHRMSGMAAYPSMALFAGPMGVAMLPRVPATLRGRGMLAYPIMLPRRAAALFVMMSRRAAVSPAVR